MNPSTPVSEDNFKWTDELVMKIVGEAHRDGFDKKSLGVYDRVQQFKKSKTDTTSSSRIEVIIPKGFMNVAVSIDNCLIADTNDSANWDTIKFPLPIGNWTIHSICNKSVIITNTNPQTKEQEVNTNKEGIAVKPPLGIIPELLWKEKRLEDLEDAIARYIDAKVFVPLSWCTEAYLLKEEIKNREQAKTEKVDKPLDWGILECKTNVGTIHPYSKNECFTHPNPISNCTIHSVRRISDNEVFTVGDEINSDTFKAVVPYKIERFHIAEIGTDKGTLYIQGEYPVTFSFPISWAHLSKISKQ